MSIEKFLRAVLLALPGLIAGCAAVPDSSAPSAPSGQAAPAQPALPEVTTPAPETQGPQVDAPPPAPAASRSAGVDLSPELVYSILLAEIAAQRGELGLAYGHYFYAAKSAPSPDLARRATRIALFLKAQDKALEAAKLWVSLAPQDDEAHQLAGLLLLRDGLNEQALEHFQRLLEKQPDNRDSRLLQIAALLAKEEPGQPAIELIQALNNMAPTAAGFHGVAVVAAASGNRPLTIQASRRGLSMDPSRARARLLLGASLIGAGQLDEGLTELGRAAADAKDDILVGLSYAQALREAGRREAALSAFRALAERHPEQAEVGIALGELALKARDYETAAEQFQKLTDHPRLGNVAVYQMARIRFEQNRLPAARRWYGRVDGELALDARLQEARITGRLGDVPAARQSYSELLAEADDAEITQINLSESTMLRESGQPQEALKVLDAALMAHPGDEDLLYARALLGAEINRLEILERDLLAILDNNPNHADALNALGYTLADRTPRLDEAETYIRQAYALDPDNAAVLDSMGWLLYRRGDSDQALGFIQRAHQLYPDGEISAHLGEILWSLGKHQDANEVWRKALALDPENAVVRESMRRLTK